MSPEKVLLGVAAVVLVAGLVPAGSSLASGGSVPELALAPSVPLGGPTVDGKAFPRTTLTWAGRDWLVQGPGVLGPSGVTWSNSSQASWVDKSGNLHLRVYKDGSKWVGPELASGTELGYGTYRWTVSRSVGSQDLNTVLGMFIYDRTGKPAEHEVDLENSRFGVAGDPDGQYVVQPYYAPEHRVRYDLPSRTGSTTQQFTWAPGRVVFSTWRGTRPSASTLVSTHEYVGRDVPAAGRLLPLMNLWQFGNRAPKRHKPVEVVLKDFTYTPAS